MNKKQSKDFLGLKRNLPESGEDAKLGRVFIGKTEVVKPPLRYAVLGESVTMEYLIEDMHKVVTENRKLNHLLSQREIQDKKWAGLNKQVKALEDENRAFSNTIQRVVHQRNYAERELNRLQHNVYKFIATKLAELEDVDYTGLEEVDKHYWREFAALEMKWFMG
jgi:gamma-glutamylcysteine synthetase